MINQSKDIQLTLLEKYRNENPYQLDKSGFDKILFDIMTPRDDMVYDEYLDFLLWCSNMPGRQESFFTHLINSVLLDFSNCKKILEVGCGKNAWLANELAKNGYLVSCIDPALKNNSTFNKNLSCYNLYLDYKNGFCLQLIRSQDLVIAQEPCDATEHIIRACELTKTPYYIILCGAPHMRTDQIMPNSVWDWYRYLKGHAHHGILKDTEIAGLHYYVMQCLNFNTK